MSLPGTHRLRRAVNSILNRVRGRAAILLYHRVAEHVPDPQLLCVAPNRFAEHVEHISRHYQVMSLARLAAAACARRVPRRAVSLTFDDGYVDNLCNARPILERYGCPATVFVASGFVGRDDELPSDVIERILFLSPRLPRSLSLEIEGRTLHWELGDEGSQESAWDVAQDSLPSSRHVCYRGLHRELKAANHQQRTEAIRFLLSWANVSPSGRPDRRIMNAMELARFIQGGLADVGAHTVHHVLLAAQSVAEQKQEIFRSREMLEQMLGRPVSGFAYPYGDSSSMTAETVSLVREAGFSFACANIEGLVHGRSERFLLPRYLVRNWSGEEFGRRLSRFFGD